MSEGICIMDDGNIVTELDRIWKRILDFNIDFRDRFLIFFFISSTQTILLALILWRVW